MSKNIMQNSGDPIGDRMKSQYEVRTQTLLPRRTYTIIRLDGKAFHTYTRKCKRPYDDDLMFDMDNTAKFLCENIQGCKLAYVQSDEISLVLADFDDITTEAWFDGNVQKITSISAAMAAAKFNQLRVKRVSHKPYIEDIIFAWRDAGLSWEDIDKLRKTKPYNTFSRYSGSEDQYIDVIAKAHEAGDISFETFAEEHKKEADKLAFFDSRVFTIPDPVEVHNYFVWRQQDATRNSIQMAAQSMFSHKELQGVNCDQLQEKMFSERQVNWNEYPDGFKRGRCVVKETYSTDQAIKLALNYGHHTVKEMIPKELLRSRWSIEAPPIFTQDRDFILSRLPRH